VRVLLVALLALGLAGLAAAPERPALLFGLLAMLVAFLLGTAKLAIDLIELSRRELSADAVALVAVVAGLTQITTASRLVIGALIALALVAHALALGLALARRRVS
jgi:hypothetical protein